MTGAMLRFIGALPTGAGPRSRCCFISVSKASDDRSRNRAREPCLPAHRVRARRCRRGLNETEPGTAVPPRARKVRRGKCAFSATRKSCGVTVFLILDDAGDALDGSPSVRDRLRFMCWAHCPGELIQIRFLLAD